MILAQGRFWRAEARKSGDGVALSVLKDGVRTLSGEVSELKELKIDVPLTAWTRVVKNLRSDRKLLGGILLDFARPKEALASAIAHDRLFHALQDVVADTTTSLVEEGLLSLVAVEGDDSP